jgi:hypothetical protein
MLHKSFGCSSTSVSPPRRNTIILIKQVLTVKHVKISIRTKIKAFMATVITPRTIAFR